VTDKDFLLAVLSDGKPRTLTEILQRSIAERGHAFTVHSRAADLRRDGYKIVNWHDPSGTRGAASVYQLVTLEEESARAQGPVASALSSSSVPGSPGLLAVDAGALELHPDQLSLEAVA
jgi:hypothetical protein